MKHKYLHHILLQLILALGFNVSHAAITIDSVHVTTSTCPNNGTAKVYARSTNSNAVFLFNITSGPVTYTQQNDSTFYSLYPGNYTGWVHDVNSFDSTRFVFTVTGNYVYPVVTASAVQPSCANSNNGSIIGHVAPGTGFAPYKWQLILPDSTFLQTSNIITGLDTNIYTIRLVDGCGVARVTNISLDSVESINTRYYLSVSFINCDTAQFLFHYNLTNPDINRQLKFVINHNGQLQTFYSLPVPDSTVPTLPVPFVVKHNVVGIQYGDTLSVCVYDSCGNSACSYSSNLSPFAFNINFSNEVIGCSDNLGATLFIRTPQSSTPYITTFSPIEVTLFNLDSGYTTLDSIYNQHGNIDLSFSPLLGVAPQPAGNYVFKVKDLCGNSFVDSSINWPVAPQPYVEAFPFSLSENTIDSAIAVLFEFFGFDTTVSLTINSGPPIAQSSRPGYQYRDSIIYPKRYNSASVSNGAFIISNCPAGHYSYTITDSCARYWTDTFTITEVHTLGVSMQLNKHCSGLTDLRVNTQYSQPTFLHLRDTSGRNIAGSPHYNEYTFLNLLPGQYKLYETYWLPFNSMLDTSQQLHIDTIYIPAYNDSTLKATDVVQCNGVINLYLEIDSANGIPPFKYEIISGLDTVAPQNSPYFTVNQFGTYLVGVIDSCGNIDARYVTVDTGRFDPVVRTGGLCSGSEAKLYDVASPFFTYVWTSPGGHVYVGDTLTVYPLTDADTGIYNIKKIVQINDCRDSAYGTYHFAFKDTFQQVATICPGSAFHFGHNIYTQPGVYIDTLTGVYGCDSIIYLSLSYFPEVIASITKSDTSLCRIGNVTLTATGGNIYSWASGQTTNVIIVNPQTTTTYTVSITSNLNNCSVAASATVVAATDTSMQITTSSLSICPGDSTVMCAPAHLASYSWSNNNTTQCIAVTQPGSYYLAATNGNGCPLLSDTVQIQQYTTTQPVIILFGNDLTSTISYASYQWYLNGNIIIGATGHILTQLSIGSYTLQATDLNGCTATSAPYIISSINNVTNFPQISVSPNPNSTNQWQVTVSAELINAQCQVFDVDGKEAYTTHLTGTNNNIKTNLSAGSYIMRISSGQSIYNIKLVQF